jgi:hypothetical protein
MLSVSTTSSATTKNANFDGDWLIKATGEGHLLVTGEDVATGEFGGSLVGPHATLDIVDGEVTGNAYTFTVEIADTVVGENGAQFTYGGTFSGNTMTITETALHVWKNGHPVSASSTNPGPFTGTREEFDLSGTIMFGCSGDGTSCSSASSPLYDATVDVEGPSSDSTTTDIDGTWKVSVAAGDYVITPTAPGVTFTPASLDVDVTKNVDGQDFSGCGATSPDDASTPDLRISSHANSGAWSLGGVYCWNTYHVTYSPSTGRASVTWISDAWVCDLNEASQFVYAEFGRTFYDNAIVGSDATPGRSFPEKGGAIVQVQDAAKHLVMSFQINAGGASGTVTTYGMQYGKTILRKGVERFCQPVDGANSPLPHLEKKGKVKSH